MRHQHLRKHVHHTLGDGVFQNFINISAQSACVYAILTPDNCVYEMERVIATVDEHANTSSASIPLALDVAVRDGRIKPGDVLNVGMHRGDNDEMVEENVACVMRLLGG